ncbi:MAG: hypothetical protein J5766_02135, partial [Clostridia bacterium]|nr:hypothetical protein [Clostridia bacterium]
MRNVKTVIVFILCIVFAINLCGCENSHIKTIKKTVITPVTKYETRVVGQRIIGEEETVYSDENENGIIDDFEDSGPGTSSNDNSSDTTDSGTTVKKMTDNFLEANKLNYRIIRGSSCEDFVTVITRNFASTIKEKLNCSVEFKTDAISANKEIRELIIADTNRPASAYAEKQLRKNRSNCYYDAIVCTVGNDICIFGYEREALVKATEHFVEKFCDGNTKKVPKDYTWIYEGNSSHTVFPNSINISLGNLDVSDFRIIIPKNYSSYEVGCARYLQRSVSETSATPIDIALDSVAAVQNEIHIGNTNRNISAPADNSKYAVKFDSGKLYYSSKSEELMYMAVKDLCESLKV